MSFPVAQEEWISNIYQPPFELNNGLVELRSTINEAPLELNGVQMEWMSTNKASPIDLNCEFAPIESDGKVFTQLSNMWEHFQEPAK